MLLNHFWHNSFCTSKHQNLTKSRKNLRGKMKQYINAAKHFGILFLLCGFFVGFIEAFGLEDLQDNIKKSLSGKTMQGKFTQEKQLKGFSNAIKSFGTFSLVHENSQESEEKTLFWEIHSPIKSTIKITPKGVFQKELNPQNQDTQNQVSKNQNLQNQSPINKTPSNQTKWIAINNNQEMLLEILSIDFKALQKYFTFSFTQSGEVWQLVLKPKNALIAKVFDSILLQGKIKYPSLLEKIVLYESNGDITTNIFSNIKIQ
ncbi:hypothetical protein CQA40_05080 [Helicobacter sp. MIT 01-3238]|nr:hypothetical protein CQA40_05080 [Helicobacter sp. MIT 01-3238]